MMRGDLGMARPECLLARGWLVVAGGRNADACSVRATLRCASRTGSRHHSIREAVHCAGPLGLSACCLSALHQRPAASLPRQHSPPASIAHRASGAAVPPDGQMLCTYKGMLPANPPRDSEAWPRPLLCTTKAAEQPEIWPSASSTGSAMRKRSFTGVPRPTKGTGTHPASGLGCAPSELLLCQGAQCVSVLAFSVCMAPECKGARVN